MFNRTLLLLSSVIKAFFRSSRVLIFVALLAFGACASREETLNVDQEIQAVTADLQSESIGADTDTLFASTTKNVVPKKQVLEPKKTFTIYEKTKEPTRFFISPEYNLVKVRDVIPPEILQHPRVWYLLEWKFTVNVSPEGTQNVIAAESFSYPLPNAPQKAKDLIVQWGLKQFDAFHVSDSPPASGTYTKYAYVIHYLPEKSDAAQLSFEPPALGSVRRPNIIYIMADDLGYGDLRSYNPASPIYTPNLDRLAKDGMRFDQYYTNGTVCSPTRVSFITGGYPQRLNFRHVCNGNSHIGVPKDFITIPEIFHEAGYTTAHVGKWHIGNTEFDPELGPIGIGFDTAAVHRGMLYYNSYLQINDDLEQKNWTPLNNTHLTEGLTNKALQSIEKNKDAPFFLNLWYLAPHISPMDRENPYHAPKKWLDFYTNTQDPRYRNFNDLAVSYAALVSYMDEEIGRLLQKLDELGLTENTIVIFTSDNGAIDPSDLVRKGAFWSTGSLRGYKGKFFEGGIKVPLIIKWPGKISKNVTNSTLLTTVDFLPTFAELSGEGIPSKTLLPEGQVFDGKSFADVLLTGKELVREESFFWEASPNPVPLPDPERNKNRFAVRKGPWKMVQETSGNEAEQGIHFFNIQTNPTESDDSNLAGGYPEVVQALTQEYKSWRRETSKIQPRVDVITGKASVENGEIWEPGTFVKLKGGRITLEGNSRFDFHDRSFSLIFLLRPDEDALENPSVLIEKPGSWRISSQSGGQIYLDLYGDDGEKLSFNSGEKRLMAGKYNRIILTIQGWIANRNIVKLDLNRERVIEGRGPISFEDIPWVVTTFGVAVSKTPISLGNDVNMNMPFRGIIQRLQFFGMSLTDEEKLDLIREEFS